MKTNYANKRAKFGHQNGSKIPRININLLKDMEFSEEEVLLSDFDITIREKDFEYALALGRFYRKRVLIIFKSVNGIYKIINRASGLKDGKLYLNPQISIPRNCIVKIKFLADGN